MLGSRSGLALLAKTQRRQPGDLPMNARIASVAALLLALVIPLKSFAEDQTKLTPAQIADGRSKAQVANTLIIIGRSAKDPDMLLVAAKLLSTVEAPVADPKATSA